MFVDSHISSSGYLWLFFAFCDPRWPTRPVSLVSNLVALPARLWNTSVISYHSLACFLRPDLAAMLKLAFRKMIQDVIYADLCTNRSCEIIFTKMKVMRFCLRKMISGSYLKHNNSDLVFQTRTIFLKANVYNFRKSVDSREFFNFFIFCPNNLYSTLISKITLKLVTAFYFFRNQAKFEKL